MKIRAEIEVVVKLGQSADIWAPSGGYPSETRQTFFSPNPATGGQNLGKTTGSHFEDTSKGIVWAEVYFWRKRKVALVATEQVREWGWVDSSKIMAKDGSSIFDNTPSSSVTPTTGDARILAEFKRDYPQFPTPLIVREGGQVFYSWKGQNINVEDWDALPLSQKQSLSSGQGAGDLFSSFNPGSGSGKTPTWQIGLFAVLGTTLIGLLVYLFTTQRPQLKKKHGR